MSELSSTSAAGACDLPTRHQRLYVEDEPIIFLVDGVLFKVHRYFFQRHSKFFSDMFAMPPGTDPEGKSDECPIQIPEVSSVDFERLLSLFYPQQAGGDLSTVEEWSSVLALATRWDFSAHRELAIARLAKLASSVDRILLARQYDVPEWLQAAYMELCKRDETLTLEEGVRLGVKDVIYVADIRQRIRGNYRGVAVQDATILRMIETKLTMPDA